VSSATEHPTIDADVIVLGGGPAGATTAALLAVAGHRVIVLEREHFPRFHIGESLLPRALPVLRRLGLDPGTEGFLVKRGAAFVHEPSGRLSRFAFADGLDPALDHAFQVDRATFDTWLLDAAARLGAQVRHGVSVERVLLPEQGGQHALEGHELGASPVVVHTDVGVFRTRYFVDASGQAAHLARARRTLEPIRDFGKAAAFRRYTGIAPAIADELAATGDIFIMIYDDVGWGWVIPLAGRELSVGVVNARGSIGEDVYARTAGASSRIGRWIAGATEGELGLLGNWSYRNTAPHGVRFGSVGDAACFVDPLFSTGVMLGLVAAASFADTLDAALRAGREHDAALMVEHQCFMARGYEAFERFVGRFYATDVAHHLLLAEDPPADMRRGVVAMLAGDVWRDDNPFQRMLFAARRR
jgi:flavin-dependent dehydrogenase